MPVIFPPGRANDLMKPDPTGSEAGPITIGIVEVARWAAITAGVATATITVRAESKQFAHQRRQAVKFPFGVPGVDDEVLALDVAKFSHLRAERVKRCA
jgi:hypothetical protein